MIFLLTLIIIHFNFDNMTQFVQRISSLGKGKEEKAENWLLMRFVAPIKVFL